MTGDRDHSRRDPGGGTVVIELPFVFPKATFVGVTGALP